MFCTSSFVGVAQWGLDVGIDATTFVFKEFWPDINRKLFHQNNKVPTWISKSIDSCSIVHEY